MPDSGPNTGPNTGPGAGWSPSAAEAFARRATLAYLLLAGGWTASADRLLGLLTGGAPDPTGLVRHSAGALFVALSALLVHLALRRQGRALAAAHAGLAASRAQGQRLLRLHQALSGIHGAILRLRDRDRLLQEACRLAVAQGGFRLAWIGLVDPDEGVLRPAAWDGPAAPYLQGLAIPLRGQDHRGRGPTGRAVREDRSVVCNDILADPAMAPWRERAREFGFRSSAALPLRAEGRVVGALNLYAPEPGFFHREELRLLEDLAADIGLGLAYLEKARRLEYLSHHDPVTELPNRSLFEDRVQQALARLGHTGRRAAVVVLDVHQFRRITDTHGRQVGDRVLQAMARHLRRCLRDGDSVAHLGRNEFALLLVDLARDEDAARVVQELLATFPLQVPCHGETVPVHVRAGASLAPGSGARQAAALVRQAELALYNGRGRPLNTCTFFTAQMDAEARERQRLVQELHRALEAGELQLRFQPVVALATGEPWGAEALLRWHSAALGEVPPQRFVPVAEETGLIVPIGAWVLEEAARRLLAWRARRPTFRLSVNVSAQQLLDDGLLEALERPAVRQALEAGGLGLEITETSLIGNLERAAEVLAELRGRGLAVYLDDFGTGYSSLAYLDRLPVDLLKIDRSFVPAAARGQDSLVRGILGLAGALGLPVIAEGIESAEQIRALRRLGCRLGQGYHLGRPMPAEALADRLADRRTDRWDDGPQGPQAAGGTEPSEPPLPEPASEPSSEPVSEPLA